MESGPLVSSPDKGKGKLYSEYSFYKDGLFSAEAIKILDEGSLKPYAKAFRRPVLNLEEEVFDGVFAKDVLDCAIKGTLPDLLSSIPLPISQFKPTVRITEVASNDSEEMRARVP